MIGRFLFSWPSLQQLKPMIGSGILVDYWSDVARSWYLFMKLFFRNHCQTEEKFCNIGTSNSLNSDTANLWLHSNLISLQWLYLESSFSSYILANSSFLKKNKLHKNIESQIGSKTNIIGIYWRLRFQITKITSSKVDIPSDCTTVQPN